MSRLSSLAAAVFLLASTTSRAASEVRLPLSQWEQLLDETQTLERQREVDPGAAVASRRLVASFERGVLSGRLEVELEATVGKEPLAVAVIGAAASLSDVRLDGERAVATGERGAWAVLVGRSGRHRVDLGFAAGAQQDRFTRAVHLPLPPAAVTLVSLDLPEADLEVQVDGGVVLSQSARGAGTHVEAALGNTDGLSVRWQRRLGQTSTARELEARAYALVSVREDVLRCESVVAYHVLAGEVSRLEVELPPAVEVTAVTGDAVLQWTTELGSGGARKLLVLLRYLVDDEVRVSLHTQMPRGQGGTELKLPRPLGATLREGFIAVEGRAGMEIAVAEASGVTEMGTRELPRELVELSQKPLLFGYRYEAEPRLTLTARRNAEVTLTDAVIDELEAATVVVEQGLEITKLRLFVRNNTRQYLSLGLPAGATLTHALIDGTPFHPAVSRPAGGPEVLLVPLRQSERVRGGERRVHRVRPGETLGGLALRYFNKVDRVGDLLAANPSLRSARSLAVGQVIVIPRLKRGTTVEESSFVVELAYKLERGRLRLLGRQSTTLPALDLPVMTMSWQYFFPSAFEPVSVSTSLKQHSAIRYGPVERVGQFLRAALSGRQAWAGGGQYSNILKSRKAIFQAEQKAQVSEALAAFPLVGERYRFSRVLLGERQGEIAFVYLSRSVMPIVRALAFVSALVLALLASRRARAMGLAAAARGRGVVAAFAVVLAWLVVAYFILGVHRAMLWGVNTALLAGLARDLWARIRERLAGSPAPRLELESVAQPRAVLKLAAVTFVAFLASLFPMLLGLACFVTLVALHLRRLPRLGAAVATALLLMGVAPAAAAQEITLPVETWSAARQKLEALRRGPEGRARAVIVGETSYTGRAEAAGLRLHLSLRAQLGEGPEVLRVPIVGAGAVLLSATSGGRALALEREGDVWQWVTRERGAVTVEADLLVPPSGRRGSLEYRFGVVSSPATQLTCQFPEPGLSPQATGAVVNRVRAVAGGTELSAVLGPVREIHVVGFHDIDRGTDARAAKLYAESQSLFSFSDDAVELFTVVKLTILYAPQKRFRIALPAGYELVKAEGEGAFQYTLGDERGRRVLTGETAYGIRQRYELSLRLRHPLAPGATTVPLAPPTLLEVERDSGFIAVEVPGKVSIAAVDGGSLRGIDVRELPPELIESSVTPIVRAFQYDQGDSPAVARIARYPEAPLAAGGVDELRVETVLTGDGRAMTDLTFSLRNNLQQYLSLELGPDAAVRSAFLEGEPVKPSRDAGGRLLLPLVRSQQGARGLSPIRLQLVYESREAALGVFGGRRLTLPRVSVPVASLRWTVHLPARVVTSRLFGDVEPQRFVKNAFWQPAADTDAGLALEQAYGDDELNAPAGRQATLEERDEGEPEEPPAPQAQMAMPFSLSARAPTMPPPQAGADAAGAVSVRIEVPRTGSVRTHARYWIGAGEPVSVRFRYVGASWLMALEVLGAALVALLLAAAAWPRPWRLAPTTSRRRAAGGLAGVLACALALGVGAWPAALGVAAGVIAVGVPRDWWTIAWRRLIAAARETVAGARASLERDREAIAAQFNERRGKSVVWALLGPTGTLAWLGARLVVLAILVASLVTLVARLLDVLGHPA